MNDSKYYTPKLEEFYTGFEFEYYCEEGSLLSRKDTICEYKNQICDSDWFNIFFDEYEHEDIEYIKSHYRVKYLDKEDIESLEFKFKGKDDTRLGFWSKKEVIIPPDKTPMNIGIEYDIISKRIFIGNWGRTLFDGSIKNKSELIKLLKQLNINE